VKPVDRKSVFSTTILLFPLLVLELGGHAPSLVAQSTGTFIATGNMTTPRAQHTATLLTNGKILIVGGVAISPQASEVLLASAELYDPTSGTFAVTGHMNAARRYHTATLLADGRVLIVGGYGIQGFPTGTELYDPSTGTFIATTGPCPSCDTLVTTTLLQDGRVLIGGPPTPMVYDPATDSFSAAGAYAGTGEALRFTSTSLPNGRVLLTGDAGLDDFTERVELYDPHTGAFTATGSLNYWMDLFTATLLMDGKVLIAGGENDWFMFASAELYNPSTGTFSSTGSMTAPREFHAATLLPDGKVLITGSSLVGGAGLASAELYDPAVGTFSATSNMTATRFLHTSTLLPDGKVLIAGGYSPWAYPTASAELYRPPLLQAAPSLLSLSGTGRGQGAIQHADTYQVASATNPAVVGEALVIYCAGLGDGSVIPPQVAIGGRMAEVLWFGNTPGFVGLNQVNVRVPSGVAAGPDISVRLTYLNRPSNEVTIGVR
jgi:Galactose oxidase, central domain